MTLILVLLYAALLKVTRKQTHAAWGVSLPGAGLLGFGAGNEAWKAVMEATGNAVLASERSRVAVIVAGLTMLAGLRFAAFSTKVSNATARIVRAGLAWAAANGVAQIAINIAGYREAGVGVAYVGAIGALVGAVLGGLALVAERFLLPGPRTTLNSGAPSGATAPTFSVASVQSEAAASAPSIAAVDRPSALSTGKNAAKWTPTQIIASTIGVLTVAAVSGLMFLSANGRAMLVWVDSSSEQQYESAWVAFSRLGSQAKAAVISECKRQREPNKDPLLEGFTWCSGDTLVEWWIESKYPGLYDQKFNACIYRYGLQEVRAPRIRPSGVCPTLIEVPQGG